MLEVTQEKLKFIPRRVRHFDLSGTPAEVVQTCVQYYRLLEGMLAEFLRVNGSAAQQGAVPREPRG